MSWIPLLPTENTEHEAAKREAYKQLKRAVECGLLYKAGNCEQCRKLGPTHGHHEDYSKPLDVQWLCASCHGKKPKPRYYEDIDISKWPNGHRKTKAPAKDRNLASRQVGDVTVSWHV